MIKEEEKQKEYKNLNYEIINLAWTLYYLNPPKQWFSIVFAIGCVVRLYVFIFLIIVLYYTVEHDAAIKWMWTLVVIATRILYILLVLRVGLS